ncbi:MAG: UbiH/UbiF/VisC/COQ6 family ubiquinone biosynthesis hydroxylase [Candidatus Latescibacterota bacterium]
MKLIRVVKMGSEMAKRYEVTIVGGGLAGMTLACALADRGIATAVIERFDPLDMRTAEFDGRTTSIAHGSAQVLKGIGLWPLVQNVAEPILDIRVADGHPTRGVSPFFLHYDHNEVGSDPFGYIIENRKIRDALYDFAASQSALEVIAPATVENTERSADGASVELSDGRVLQTSLIVGADGQNSPLRKSAGIGGIQFRYQQTAIVCSVEHEREHAGVAVELFLPSGPFAMLPMTGRRTNVVWTEKAALAPEFLAMDEDTFLAEVQRRFGDWLGALRLVGPRLSYPLGLMHASRYTDLRLALIGEAAHVIHPIAGQGFNLGIRDVAALAETIVDAVRLGLEPADPTVLDRYETWRRLDNTTLVAVTDVLNRLFSNDLVPVRMARDAGMTAVGKIPPLKRVFMRHAMGVVGELPRLVRGEAL